MSASKGRQIAPQVETFVRWCFRTSAAALLASTALTVLAVIQPAVASTVIVAIGVAGSIGTAAIAAAAVLLKRIRT